MKPLTRDDQSTLFLLVAVLLGGLVRFLPVVMAGFPVNDGGMFLVMSDELKANQYVLPAFTAYNQAQLPFAYPPFGFYMTAFLSGIFQVPTLEVVRWMPALVSTLSLLAFSFLAFEILKSRLLGGLATLFYALAPASFGWAIMGGGITRSFGLLFLYLTVAFASRLFTRPRGLTAFLTALCGALAVLSHPETGLQAAGACILLWLFRGRTRSSLGWSILVAIGVLVFTVPWWGTVLSTHGFAPFQSAMNTSQDNATWLVQLITLQIDGNSIFFNLTIALGLIGLAACLAHRKHLLPLWFLLPFLVDPRSAAGISMIPMAMMAAFGFDQILAPALLAQRQSVGEWIQDRFAVRTLFVIAIYLFLNAGIFGIRIATASLSDTDRVTLEWVEENVQPGSTFLLLTGEEYSMKDPLQEWFPALTENISVTTIQGYEWTLGPDFFPRYGDLVALQHCADVTCLTDWTDRTGLAHHYLLIKVPTEDGSTPLRASLNLLLESARKSDEYQLAYESNSFLVYEKTK